MDYKIIKMDRRFTGHQDFGYIVDIKGKGSSFVKAIEFQYLRNWLTASYGPSAEYDIWCKLQAVPLTSTGEKLNLAVDTWAWDIGPNRYRILLQDDVMLTHFILSHPA